MLLKINNSFTRKGYKYKCFICNHALALFIDNDDQQLIFFMPLIARDYGFRKLKMACRIDYHALYLLTPISRLKQFSSSDLYFEMLSNKFGKSTVFEHKNLKGFCTQNISRCIDHNFLLKVGKHSLALQPFETSCCVEINSLLDNESFNWLK